MAQILTGADPGPRTGPGAMHGRQPGADLDKQLADIAMATTRSRSATTVTRSATAPDAADSAPTPADLPSTQASSPAPGPP